jgi:hypothetical protein
LVESDGKKKQNGASTGPAPPAARRARSNPLRPFSARPRFFARSPARTTPHPPSLSPRPHTISQLDVDDDWPRVVASGALQGSVLCGEKSGGGGFLLPPRLFFPLSSPLTTTTTTSLPLSALSKNSRHRLRRLPGRRRRRRRGTPGRRPGPRPDRGRRLLRAGHGAARGSPPHHRLKSFSFFFFIFISFRLSFIAFRQQQRRVDTHLAFVHCKKSENKLFFFLETHTEKSKH